MTYPEPLIRIFQDREIRAVTAAELEQLTPGTDVRARGL